MQPLRLLTGWLIFYKPADDGMEIMRVPYGNVNWRQEPERFF